MSVPVKHVRNFEIPHGGGAPAPVLLHPMHRLGSPRGAVSLCAFSSFSVQPSRCDGQYGRGVFLNECLRFAHSTLEIGRRSASLIGDFLCSSTANAS